MPYRLRYVFNVDWVPPGTGSVQPNSATSVLGSSGGGATKGFINQAGGQNVAGAGTSGAINATDVTTLTNAAAVDMAAQLNAALTQLIGFNTGGG
jgi:hypothetical protein